METIFDQNFVVRQQYRNHSALALAEIIFTNAPGEDKP